MILLFSRIFKKNRPVGNRRPVFLLVLIWVFLALGLSAAVDQVQARAGNEVTSPTTTPDNRFAVPESGEPVILLPGNNARLVSPLSMQLITKPGDDGLVRIELIGKDNRLIFRKLLDYRSYKGKNLLIEQVIPFEIRNDESARLQVVLEDVKGRTIFINSINITLLGVRGRESTGDAPVNPHFRIDLPDSSSVIKGKTLTLQCGIKPINNTPVNVELVASDGHTLSSRLVPMLMPNDQTAFTTLKVEMPIKVLSPTIVTLRIRQESNNLIKGTVLLWSKKITINP